MSLKPGIGAWLMDDVASTLLEHQLEDMKDVPISLRHGERLWPLGRYLRRRLRERIGRPPECPAEVLEEMASELRPLRSYSQALAPSGSKAFAFQQAIIEEGLGKIIQAEHRQRFRNRKSGI
jgi:hypothetical protein